MVAIVSVSSLSPAPSPTLAAAVSLHGGLDLGEWTGPPYISDPNVRCDHLGISRGSMHLRWDEIERVHPSVETNYGEMTHRLVLVASGAQMELTRSSVRSRQQRDNQQAFEALIDAVSHFAPDRACLAGALTRP